MRFGGPVPRLIIKGRWTAQTLELIFSWRTCALYRAVPDAVGVSIASRESVRGGWCVSYATLRELFYSVRREYADLPYTFANCKPEATHPTICALV